MAHSFDHDRPEHRVHHLKVHHSHANEDQKLDKAGRSPMAAQLPPEGSLEMPDLDQNQAPEPGALGAPSPIAGV